MEKHFGSYLYLCYFVCLFSSDEKLHFGVIICSLGVRYRFYCSNIVRTLMVEPTQEQQDLYTYLLSLMDLVIEKLRDGKVFIKMDKDDVKSLMRGVGGMSIYPNFILLSRSKDNAYVGWFA